jgi:hypothetical protein
MKQQKSLSPVAQWAVAIFFALFAQAAMAAGFEAEATSMITNIRNGIYTIVGVIATIALLWQFAQGWMGRKTWGDILETSMWIVGAGAGVALATWLFTNGGKMSF